MTRPDIPVLRARLRRLEQHEASRAHIREDKTPLAYEIEALRQEIATAERSPRRFAAAGAAGLVAAYVLALWVDALAWAGTI